jgi:hypothetical protein
LLQCSDGEFSFAPQDVHHTREASSLLGAEQILMDGLRVTDEWSALEPKLPAETAVYKLAKDSDEILGELESNVGSDGYSPDDAMEILQLVNGERTVREIVDRAMQGTYEGMRILVRFIDWGVIEKCGRSSKVAEIDGGGSALSIVNSLGSIAASIVPFVLLASLMLVADKQPLRKKAQSSGVPVMRDQMVELKVNLETLRLKRALVTGRWLRLNPRDLRSAETFATRVGVSSEELISSTNQPYYYVKELRGYVPLAPVREISHNP